MRGTWATLGFLIVLNNVGGLDFDFQGLGGAKVVGWRKDELGSARVR